MRTDDDKDDPKYGLPEGKTEEEFMAEVLDRFQDCQDFDADMRRMAVEDIEFTFIAGEQWDSHMRQLRADRPCYEFNRVRQSVRQITGDQLQNRPGIKVRAVEDGDEDTAEILQGLIRNIESVSNAERAYDNAFTYSCTGGYGVWRVATVYSDDEAFDQDIAIQMVRNPFSVYFDPGAHEFDKRDAQFAFVVDSMTRQAFRARYPKADMVDFESTNSEQLCVWWNEESVQVAEYWYKEPYTKTILLLSDGATVDKDDFDAKLYAQQQPQPPQQPGQPPASPLAPVTIVKERKCECERVFVCTVSGSEVLGKREVWPGKFIPLVPVWGDVININGKDHWSGIVRPAKDSQRLHNFATSTAIEMVAEQPIQPFMAAAKSVKGFERQWENLNVDRSPVLFYNPDPSLPNGGMPTRSEPPAFPAAWANISQIATNEIKATLGIYDASLGAPSNETSGKAILARQKEGDTANFVYVDNLNKALKYTGEILIDLTPHIYDADRQIRILGEDGAAKFIAINHAVKNQMGQWETINDISVGKYDVTVTTGPSYTTQRMETADAMMQLSQAKGPFSELAQFAFLKSLDTPGLDEIQAAARRILVNQGLLQPDQDDPPPQPKPPASIADSSMQGQQVVALTAILTDVGSGALSPQTAIATIMAAFPTLNPQLIAEMVKSTQQGAQQPGAQPGQQQPTPAEAASHIATAQLKSEQAIHERAKTAATLAGIQPTVQRQHAEAARAEAEAAVFLHHPDVRLDLGANGSSLQTNPVVPGHGQ